MRFKDLKITYCKGKPPKIKEGSFLLPYLTPDYIRIGSIPEFFPFQPGIVLVGNNDLILLWDGSNAGEFFKAKKGILSSTMVKFDKIEGTDDDYIYYSLKLEEATLKSKTSGSGIPHVDKDALLNLEIFLPSKEEQTTIATILITIDQTIEKTEQLIAKYERIKTGLMQDLLTRGIDEQGNIRSEETHEFKDSVVGRIPKEWEVGRLSNWANVMGGFAFQSKDFTASGVQLLRIGNLFNIQLDLLRSPVFLHDSFLEIFSNFSLRKGDIIMSMTGTYGKRDYGYAITIENGDYLMNQRVCKFVYDESSFSSSFLLYLLRSEYYLDGLFKSVTGSKQGNLKNSNILDVEIALPRLDEQIVISDKISKTYLILKEEKKNLEKLKKIKIALMQDLLTGEVRVDTLMNNHRN